MRELIKERLLNLDSEKLRTGNAEEIIKAIIVLVSVAIYLLKEEGK